MADIELIRRSRHGVQTSEIELAVKILDSDGRLNLGGARVRSGV